MRSQGAGGSGRRTATAVLLLAASACSGQAGEGVGISPAAGPGETPIPTCRIAADPPNSFVQIADVKVPSPDHIGVRVSYRGPEQQRLHFTSGIVGEFGEALPQAGEMETVDGSLGQVLGHDDGMDWIFTWIDTDVCQQRAVTGNGVTREQFVALLVRSAVIPPMSH